MAPLTRFVAGLRGLFRKTRAEQELDAELGAFFETAVEHRRQAGLSREEATRAARMELGNAEAVKDSVRDVGWESAFESVWRDLRSGVRSLRKSPGFTTVAVLTLGLGVGATTAMFSAVNTVLLKALPYAGAGEIVVLEQTDVRDRSLRHGVSAANMRDVATMARTLSHVAIAEGPHGLRLLRDARAESLRAWLVSEGFLQAMGVQPRLGRTFLPEEFVQGGQGVVLLSHRAWQTHFGGDSAIVGRHLVLDGTDHLVVGVLPPDFKYPSEADILAPRAPQPSDDGLRAGTQMEGVARLAAGATLAQVQADLDRIATNLVKVYPGSNANTGFRAIPLRQHLLGDVETPLTLLLGAVGLVLLIAAANVAGLQLARGVGKSREYALRGSLGASSQRILRLVFLESLLLAGVGGLFGIGFAYLGVELIRMLAPVHIPRIDELGVDATVLAFALTAAIGTGLIAGIAPALRASTMGLRATLFEGPRGTTLGPRTSGLRDRLVVAELTLAVVLTIGAGLLVRSFDRLLDNRLGFDPEGRLVAQVWAYDDNHQAQLSFFERGLEKIRAVPGVETVGLTSDLPLADGQSLLARSNTIPFAIDGQAAPTPGDDRIAGLAAIDSSYAGAMGIRLRAGRDFSPQDHARSTPVLLVNEAFVRRYLSAQDAVGQHITLRWRKGTSREIVGVLADVRRQGFASEPRPEVYVPLAQEPFNGLTFVVKTDRDPAGLAKAVQEALWAADPHQATWATRRLTDLLGDWIRQRKFNTALLLAFAGLALALAGIGVYGLMSFSVEQRAHELGIRRALGGQTQDILRMVVGRAVKLTLIGAGLGLIGSAALTRLLQGMLFKINPLDLLTFGAVTLLVIAMALSAAFVPAWRATRVDPMAVLRAD